MGMYNRIYSTIEAEAATLPPGKRTQPVPCAFCARGGNGERSCSCGMNERRYSKYKGCFAGKMLEHEPTEGK